MSLLIAALWWPVRAQSERPRSTQVERGRCCFEVDRAYGLF
jgi:hypothetical protein